MDITVLIPTIPDRDVQLQRAVASVRAQTLQPAALLVQVDTERDGAAATRNKALSKVDTEWVAFVDDDDEMYPDHLKLLARHARLSGADLIYPQYDCTGPDVNDGKGHGHFFGRPFDPGLLQRANYIPVTVLTRTDKVRAAGGFQPHPDVNGDPCEDWGLWLAMAEQGCRFAHLSRRTWLWHNDENTTRGRGDRW